MRLVADDPLPGPEAGARKATEVERKAVTGAIEAQLKAFKAGDYAGAMKYQSAALREQIDNVEDFRDMMKRSYPAVCELQVDHVR